MKPTANTFDAGRRHALRLFRSLHKLETQSDWDALDEMSWDAYTGDPDAPDEGGGVRIRRRGPQNNVVYAAIMGVLDKPEALRGFCACITDCFALHYLGSVPQPHREYAQKPRELSDLAPESLRRIEALNSERTDSGCESAAGTQHNDSGVPA